MELRIDLDEQMMRAYAARGSSPNFTIYWWHNGTSFPGPGWVDFGVAILGWWLVAAERLLRGSPKERFLFMDGPYELQVRQEHNLLHVSSPDLPEPWTAPLWQFIGEIIRAAESVSNELKRLGIAELERRGLDKGVKDLRALLPE
jgi:hypothetical protein